MLSRMQDAFCDLANRDIAALNGEDQYLLQLVKNDKKDSAMRQLEKDMRPSGLNSAFCQAAFDTAVTHLSNRLDAIRLDMYAQDQSIFTQSKVLFAMSAMGKDRAEMISVMKGIAKGKPGFYADCAKTLSGMDDGSFHTAMLWFQDAYAMSSMEYRIPVLSRVEVPLDSRLMRIEPSTKAQAPYVISITDPFRKSHRIPVPLNTTKHSLDKIRSNDMAGTVMASMRDGKLRIVWSYTKSLKQPDPTKVIGVDTGILDLFHTSEGDICSSMKPALDFYQGTVEPAFADLSDLRNKKRAIKHYLHTHPGLPEHVGRSLIEKMDRLEYMIQTADAPYRKKRHYYNILDKAIKDGVSGYISGITADTLTVIERLDIKEFNKSRRVNGMFSTFARGKAQQALMSALNWKGRAFVEVAPDYTSQVCPVCGNLDKENRKGKQFLCTCCGHKDDADHVGSVNIRERAVDEELAAVCENNRYSRCGLTEALKKLYTERNAQYKKQRLAGNATVSS